MDISIRSELKNELLQLVQRAIDDQVIDRLREQTRVDTGALQEGTRTLTQEDRLYVVQGGRIECDYAVWIELRYGDFSSALSAIEWEFR